MTMAEVYVSTDIETDGPIPGPHSLLSFASAAYLADKTLVDTFTGFVAKPAWQWQRPCLGPV
jgi:hypothetical protein